MTTAAAFQQPVHRDTFHHEALLYTGLEEFTPAISEFVRAGVASDEPTMVMVSDDKIDLLRSELGADADGVAFVDMGRVGANPARIIPAWLDFAERVGNRRMRGVGEPIGPERSDAELVECRRHEELLNLAVAPEAPFWLLCPYDIDALPQAVIDDVGRTHPFVAQGDRRRTSRDYEGVSMDFDDVLPEPAEAEVVHFEGPDLAYVRDVVENGADAAGLGRRATNELVLAMNEIATNSLLYGGGRGTLRLWRDGDAVVCEVRDHGHIEEPLAGRRRPSTDRRGGRGLWMVNQLCDLTQVRSSPSGTVVRVHQRPR